MNRALDTSNEPRSPAGARAGVVEGRGTSIAAVLSLLGFVLAAGGALLHALTTFSPLPGWDLDPLVYPVPHTGLGPARSMLVDMLVQVGCAAVLAGEIVAGRRIDWRATGLLLVGAGVIWYGGRRGEPDGVSASAWIAAMTLGVAMMHACRSPRLRATVLAVLLAFVCVLALRGAQQVFIEHPETMKSFLASREQVFAAQGWELDSAMARSYTRRVSQSDATGWFGLSNVYATFAAGGAAAGLALLVMAMRGMRRTGFGAVLIGGVLCGAGVAALALSQAKGGFAALLAGAGFGAGVWLVARVIGRSKPLAARSTQWATPAGAALALGVMAGVFVLIIANAQLGARAELSLLFRWYYLKAAWTIGLTEFAGCGAGAFQPLYSLHKDPFSPEDVASAHNVLMDYWASGGVLALAWIALWGWMIARAGIMATRSAAGIAAAGGHGISEPETDRFRWEHIEPAWCIRVVAAVVLIPSMVGMKLEQPILTLDLALVRLGGMVVGGVVAWCVLIELPRRLGAERADGIIRQALGVGAISMGAHALIDQTGVWPGSASLLMMFIGAAGAGVYEPAGTTKHRGPNRAVRAVGALSVVGVLLMAGMASRPTKREELMVAALRAVEPLAGLNQRFGDAMSGRMPPVDQARALAELSSEVSAMLAGAIAPTPQAIQQALGVLEKRRLDQASNRLVAAAMIGPGTRREPSTRNAEKGPALFHDFRALREAARLQAILGKRELEHGDVDKARAWFDESIRLSMVRLSPAPASVNSDTSVARAGQSAVRVRASEYGWLSLAYEARYESLTRSGKADPADLRSAASACEQAAQLDPYSLEYPKRAMRLWARIGDAAQAATWAKRALELDVFKVHDREVQGLTDAERAEAVRLAGSS